MPPSLPKKRDGDIPLGSAPGASNSSFSFQRGSPVSASQLSQISDQAARANAFNMSQTGLQMPTFSAPSEQFVPRMFFEGILAEDMRASTDPLTDPVVVKMKLLQPTNHVESTDQAAVSFDDYGDEVNVTNRSITLSASEGDYIACARVNNEIRPIPGGGGGAEIINFEVLSACPGLDADIGNRCPCVQAQITRVLCASALQIGDFVTVWDVDTCWFNIPLDLLIGRKGTAFLMLVGENDNGQVNCSGYGAIRPGECFWSVESLCCAEEEYYSI